MSCRILAHGGGLKDALFVLYGYRPLARTDDLPLLRRLAWVRLPQGSGGKGLTPFCIQKGWKMAGLFLSQSCLDPAACLEALPHRVACALQMSRMFVSGCSIPKASVGLASEEYTFILLHGTDAPHLLSIAHLSIRSCEVFSSANQRKIESASSINHSVH